MTKHSYSFHTEDAAIAAKIFDLLKGHAPAAALAAVPSAPIAAPAQAAAVPPAPVVAPPAAEPPAAEPPKPKGEAPPGWTRDHITSAALAHSQNKGPASLKAIVESFGEKKATEVDPARWPDLYAALTAA